MWNIKIEKDGPLVSLSLLFLWIIVLIFLPYSLFVFEQLSAIMLWGGIVGIFILGVTETGVNEKNKAILGTIYNSAYTTAIHLCLLIGFILVFIFYIAFTDIEMNDIIKGTLCTLYYGICTLLIFIVEKVHKHTKGHK